MDKLTNRVIITLIVLILFGVIIFAWRAKNADAPSAEYVEIAPPVLSIPVNSNGQTNDMPDDTPDEEPLDFPIDEDPSGETIRKLSNPDGTYGEPLQSN